jgi:hypothetical protein
MSQLTKEQISAWADHIKAQRGSGLTQQAYCKQHALKPHQFWYWKRKLEGPAKQKPAHSKQTRASGFVPVMIAEPQKVSGMSITLPSGIILNGVDSTNIHLAQHLIGTLA